MSQNLAAEKETALEGQRLRALLGDAGVKKAFGTLERRYYEDFKKAKSNEERQLAQSKALVLADFLEALIAGVARGDAAQATIDRETKREEQEQERKKRYGRA